jgi:hypothetical protein
MSMQRSVQLLDAIINLRFTIIMILRHLSSPPWLNSSVQPQLLDERLCHPLMVFVVFAICPSEMEKGRDLRRALQSCYFSRLSSLGYQIRGGCTANFSTFILALIDLANQTALSC